MALNKRCPVTNKLIPRRTPVHLDVFAELARNGDVVVNPNAGTLRRFIYIGPGKKGQ